MRSVCRPFLWSEHLIQVGQQQISQQRLKLCCNIRGRQVRRTDMYSHHHCQDRLLLNRQLPCAQRLLRHLQRHRWLLHIISSMAWPCPSSIATLQAVLNSHMRSLHPQQQVRCLGLHFHPGWTVSVGGPGRVRRNSALAVLSPVAMLVVSPEPVLILNKGNMFIVLGTRKHNCIVADLCDALVHLLVAKLAQ